MRYDWMMGVIVSRRRGKEEEEEKSPARIRAPRTNPKNETKTGERSASC
jgi:hypothetical protein